VDVTLILTIVAAVFAVYTLSVSLFLVLENRSPQSTFAWLLLFVAVPIVGVLIYFFFGGRGPRAFSQQDDLIKHGLGGGLYQAIEPLFARQQACIERLAAEKPVSYKHRLLQLVSNNSYSVLTGYNQVDILQNASEKYPRLLTDIQQARQSIHLEYYIWTEDDFTRQVKAALIERTKAGVKVRCLFDATGGKLSYSYLQELREAGVAIYPYLAIDSLYKIHSINYRSHRKIAIIDGRIGYIGGLNLDKDQLDGGIFGFWRDTHLRIVGEAAHALQASFGVSWFNTTQEAIVDPVYYPDVTAEIQTFLPIHITYSGPDSQWAAIQQLYFLMILSAEKRVYIQSPFFIPDGSILDALKAAALAGVEVKMMFTPAGATYQIPYWAANTYFAEVARAGARIFLYQKGYLHPKTIIIDSAVCSVGTANMDIRSFNINYEANAVIYDQAKACELEQDFLEDLKHCTEFTLEEYRQRSAAVRLRDSLCRLASPLL
jgi:cardiolipin synthase